MKASTLNLIQSLTTAVFIVYVDLSSDKRNIYFLNIQEEIAKILGKERFFDGTKDRIKFLIPKTNIFVNSDIIDEYVESYSQKVSDARMQFFNGLTNGSSVNKQSLGYYYELEPSDLFEEEYSIEANYYLNAKSHVRVNAFLPNLPDAQITCLIQLKTKGAENCLITLDQRTLVESFFTCLNSDPAHQCRGYIVCGPTERSDKYIIQIGNCRLTVARQLLDQLSLIFDDLAKVYSDRVTTIETKLKSHSFEVSSTYKTGFRLIKIKRWLWRMIHDFAANYRIDNADSAWNIFYHDNFSLMIRVNKERQSYGNVGDLVISPESDAGFNFKFDNDEVWLVWNTVGHIKNVNGDVESKYDNSLWDVDSTNYWLKNELIPTVIYWSKKGLHKGKSGLFRRAISYPEFLASYNSEHYVCLNGKSPSLFELDAPTIQNLIKISELLQDFFHCRGLKLFTSKTALQKLYSGLSDLLQNCKIADFNYIRSNFTFVTGSNSQSIAKEFLLRSETITEGTDNNFELDMIFRTYLSILQDAKKQLPVATLIQVFKSFQPTIILAKNQSVFERCMRRYKQ